MGLAPLELLVNVLPTTDIWPSGDSSTQSSVGCSVLVSAHTSIWLPYESLSFEGGGLCHEVRSRWCWGDSVDAASSDFDGQAGLVPKKRCQGGLRDSTNANVIGSINDQLSNSYHSHSTTHAACLTHKYFAVIRFAQSCKRFRVLRGIDIVGSWIRFRRVSHSLVTDPCHERFDATTNFGVLPPNHNRYLPWNTFVYPVYYESSH